MATVYLYKYREYVHLVQADKNVPNINLPMIQYDNKLYKGVTNTIDFVIRNNDRKPISMVGYRLVAQIREVNSATNAKTPPEMLLEKDLIMIDETMGRAKLMLDPEDVQDWATGYYHFTVRTINQDGRNELLYTDINKDTWGSFELIEGLASSLNPPVIVESGKFTPTPSGNYGTRWYTGALAGDAQAQRASGTHTIAVYTTNWSGRIWVEGSLTNDAPLPSEWFSIPLSDTTAWFDFTEHNNVGVKLINFTMNLYWLRVSYQPFDHNKGSFERILYKN